MIRFHCPNGHLLTAAENLVGKSGRCPKCDTAIVVPSAEEADGAGSSGSIVAPAMGSGKNLSAGGGELFVFLCPNGHKLNGPPSLKGKPGQCPHCGARFLIPTDEDIEAAERAAEEEQHYSGHDDDSPSDPFSMGGIGSGRLGSDTRAQAGAGHPPPGPAGLGHIVSELWPLRGEDAELEIFLAEGEIVAPDLFCERLSTSDYGVFALQESDGAYAITVIPWSAVRRVGLRRLTELPEGMFS